MTQILLISDTESVNRVFESLGKNDSLQLRSAATLDQADQEIASTPPEFTFVQSRISGFSWEIILRHLKKVLPADAKIILLAANAEEVKQAQKHGVPFLELTPEDEALAAAVQDALEGVFHPRKQVAADQVSPVQKNNHAKDTEVHPKESDIPLVAAPVEEAPVVAPAKVESPKAESTKAKHAKAEQPKAEQPKAELPKAELPKAELPKAELPKAELPKAELPKAELPKAELPKAELPKAPEAVEPLTNLPLDGSDNAEAESFAEIMRLAASKVDTSSFSASAEQPVEAAPPKHAKPGKTIYPEDFNTGEFVMPRAKKKGRPLWMFALAMALIGIPVFSYLAGKRTAPPESALAPHATSSPAKPPVPAPAAKKGTAATPAPPATPTPKTTPTQKPTPAPTAAPAPTTAPAKVPIATAEKPAIKPAAKPEAQPAAKPAAKEPAKQISPPAAKPAVKTGLKSLPPIVAHAKLDPAYGKTHPGWQRHLGTYLEYKVFQEADHFKAMQVFPRNGVSIPEPLFKKVMQEFAGTDSYQKSSTGEKGKYLVEKGETKTGVAVTLYRNKTDHRMKAFVLYYR
jgi:hypothetical protein